MLLPSLKGSLLLHLINDACVVALVVWKITSRVIRNCFQRRGWRTFATGGVNQKAGSVRTSVRSDGDRHAVAVA
jgi:hypothetical protein